MKNFKKSIFVLTLVILFAFASLNLALAKNDVVSLRLPWIKNAQFAGPLVAEYKGFYKELGIDITIRAGGADVNSIPLVAAGQDTFGIHDTASLIFARGQQMPLVTLATVFQKHPGGVLTLKKSGIKEPKDFIGKTFGYNEGGPWTLTKAMFKIEGVSLDSIKLIAVPFGISSLITDKVDGKTCYTTNEPVAAELEGFEVNVLLPYDYGVKTASEAIFTTEKLIKENPDLVRRFVEATLRGWAYAIDNKEEAIDIVIEANLMLDPEHQKMQFERQLSHIWTPESIMYGIGWMSRDTWVQTQEILLEFGGLSKPIDIDKVFTLDFLPRK